MEVVGTTGPILGDPPWPADREDSTLVDGAPDCDLLDLTGVDRYRVIVENGKVSKFARLDAADLFFELQRVCRINSNRFDPRCD